MPQLLLVTLNNSLARGLLVQGARGSGLSEVKVFLIVMLVFGCIHGLNIINGQALVSTIQQIIFAGLLGGVLYTIFRKTVFWLYPWLYMHFGTFPYSPRV